MIVLARSGTNAKVGARHDEGPDSHSTYFTTHSTPIATATLSTVPKHIKGITTTASPLSPFFAPTILAGGNGALEWVTCDVYVGGKPF